MREAATEADLLIVESNHDPEMLRVGPYPWYLKQRIASDVGHLSNDNAARLLRDIANTGRAITAWLAHLSKTNNSPRVAFNTVREALASVHGAPNIKVGIALRDVPSLHWVEGIAV
jgi:phosphoribosyl 1,2-cyclic phosphodiesterase